MFLFPFKGISQLSFSGFEHLFTTPKGYIVPYTAQPPKIDGSLADEAWQAAPWTDTFVDIEGVKKPRPQYSTRVKMLWSDSSLFIAAQMEEPHVWATLKQHDAIVYHDNDFEVFIDPDSDTHQYFEFEVNAYNTILDLFMPKPYRNGAQAMLSYNAPGLQSAIKVQGTLNNPSDKDTGWTVEMAIPFSAIYLGNYWRAPREGALWRINFSRVQWDTDVVDGKYIKRKDAAGKPLPEYNWVWSPQGVINMHYPERWGFLQFTKSGTSNVAFTMPEEEARKQYLWLVYYRQKAYFSKWGKFAASLKDLDIATASLPVKGKTNVLKMEATSRQFTVYLTDNRSTFSINNDGLIQAVK